MFSPTKSLKCMSVYLMTFVKYNVCQFGTLLFINYHLFRQKTLEISHLVI